KELGKQYALFSVFPLDEALHCNPRSMASQIIADSSFSHSLRRFRSSPEGTSCVILAVSRWSSGRRLPLVSRERLLTVGVRRLRNRLELPLPRLLRFRLPLFELQADALAIDDCIAVLVLVKELAEALTEG
ncbi:hypothetical protein, partial [Rhodoblastus sp.]|uniref:hypothetical protein n=1 Tax=Rhodoblastus sp. TaxID=1962975 RepID=UPI003F97A97A